MKNNRILITGASGFIGGSLGAFFLKNGYKTTGITTQLKLASGWKKYIPTYSVESIKHAILEEKPNIIIHAAGSASVQDSYVNPSKDYSSSVELFRTVLESARDSGINPQILFLSSAAVYGNPQKLPVAETDPLKPISPYGYHKVICEELAKEYNSCFSLPILITRLFSVFGPQQKRLLVWELFNKFSNDKEVVLEGTGEESRDYLYIEDVAIALLEIITTSDNELRILNVASGNSITVKELTHKISDYFNYKKAIIFKNKNKIGDPIHWRADISQFIQFIGKNISNQFEGKLKDCLQQWQALK
jgi:UDP-glucose 4-epimerase